MNKVIEELMRFQEERDLHLRVYNALNEHGSIVEELLESIGLDVKKENRIDLKECFKEFVEKTKELGISKEAYPGRIATPMEDRVDAYCDIIVFAIGAIMKLGHNPIIALEECGKEINSRVGTMINGKFEKDLSAETYKADYDNSKLAKK